MKIKNSRFIERAVITGPTGVIGSALCRELLSHEIIVYAVCRPDSRRIKNLQPDKNLHVVFCNLCELEKLVDIIPGGADAFFHLGWSETIGPGRNDMYAQIDNIRFTIDAVTAASALRCKVFIGAGSQAEYGRVEGIIKRDTPCFPENGYGIAKLCAGNMSRIECNKRKMDFIWARVLSVYGPGDGPNTMVSSIIMKLLSGESPELTLGEQVWDYLYSDDAASAFYLLASHGTNEAVYPVGSGNARPLRDYIKIMRDMIDPAVPLQFGKIPYNQHQVMHLQADISELQNDTGFLPLTDFKTGIQKTVLWIRTHISA